jgi:hypothetical protein
MENFNYGLTQTKLYNALIDSLHIIYRHFFYYNNVSKAGLCLRPQVRNLFI